VVPAKLVCALSCTEGTRKEAKTKGDEHRHAADSSFVKPSARLIEKDLAQPAPLFPHLAPLAPAAPPAGAAAAG
jgi:hypothetical protein